MKRLRDQDGFLTVWFNHGFCGLMGFLVEPWFYYPRGGGFPTPDRRTSQRVRYKRPKDEQPTRDRLVRELYARELARDGVRVPTQN